MPETLPPPAYKWMLLPADQLLAQIRDRKARKKTRISADEILAHRDADRRPGEQRRLT